MLDCAVTSKLSVLDMVLSSSSEPVLSLLLLPVIVV